MTIKLLQQIFLAELISIYEQSEAQELFSLTAHQVSGLNRSQQIIQGEDPIDETQYKSYLHILQELKKGKPIQHIFGEAWFYGQKFKINGFVLIPRPETEELVEWIIETLSVNSNAKIIDIGTGSGCIAISLKNNIPALDVDAIDISADAITVAMENATAQSVDINFMQSDIFGYQSLCLYDLIVSNPPYIREMERSEMHNNVLSFEPSSALFVPDDDPLTFYKCIADFALTHLNQYGYLFFEINEYLGKETIEMLNSKGFKNITLKQDMQGKDRMLSCQIT